MQRAKAGIQDNILEEGSDQNRELEMQLEIQHDKELSMLNKPKGEPDVRPNNYGRRVDRQMPVSLNSEKDGRRKRTTAPKDDPGNNA